MKKIIITLLVMFALLQTSFVVHAEDGFSGFSGVRSNYMWRGYDQNRFSPIREIQVQYDYKKVKMREKGVKPRFYTSTSYNAFF